MSFAKRQARAKAERPITCKYKLWATWLMGAASYYHPGQVRGPLHPDTAREFEAGRAAAAGGYVNVPDLTEAWELARHVQAGNAPNTYKGHQLGMAL